MGTGQGSDGTPIATADEDLLVVDIAQLRASMLSLAGGKAANLGELAGAGLPVPGGFCITTEAYRRAVGLAEVDDLIDQLAGVSRGDGNPRAALALADRIRSAVRTAPVPAAVEAAVRQAYVALGPRVPVAVRSSATAEDLPFASFAGQQDTYLNVVGVDAVLEAMRRCWASLWTDRAVQYRSANGIDHADVRIAVVVQAMVDAAVAGVMFTANPVTGRRGETVIDANPGLGEAVVSGAVNPDRFVVDAATGTISERRLGDKRLSIRALPEGGTERLERATADAGPCLTDEEVLALVALGRRVEVHYGSPQDTEWALDAEGMLWLTQARPITTLYPLPADRSPENGLRVYFCISLAQGLVRPLTPMGLSALRVFSASVVGQLVTPVADPLAGAPAFVEAGSRPFIDVTGLVRGRIGHKLFPRVLDVMEARSAVVLRELSADPRFAVASTSRLPFVRRALRVAVRHRIPVRFLRAVLSPEAARRRVDRFGEHLAVRLTVPASATADERLDDVEQVLLREPPRIMGTLAPVAAAGFAMLGMASKLLDGMRQPGDLEAILRGLPHNVTTEMDLRLWQLATRVRADRSDGGTAARLLREEPIEELTRRYRRGDLPAVVQTGVTEILSRYGHRAIAEIDLGLPRWADDPTYIFGVLANYLLLGDPALAPDAQFARAAAAAKETRQRLVATAHRRSRLRGRLVALGLSRARALAGLRELPKYDLVLVLAHARRQLIAVGAEIAAAGRLADPEDVFFLTLREARQAVRGADLRDLVSTRRQAYALELRRRRVPRVLLSDGTEPEAAASGRPAVDAEHLLVGTPASAGTVTGLARVVLDPVGARLQPGQILVAPSTDPGWTPLFLTAGGLVMEMGGANSHGAVVAREYGIPAVVGVPDATRRIRDGEPITLNGSAGTVARPEDSVRTDGDQRDE
jgi:phosphohistidine swiveling domain-containing protein